MAVSSVVVSMVRVLAVIHIVVGALLIVFGIADAVLSDGIFIRIIALPVSFGVWTCIGGGLGIPASSPQRTSRRNCFAGVFMGFSIVSAACGAVLIIFYGIMVAYSEELTLGLAAVILILAIIEFGTGIWVSICLCVMKPCCTDSQQQTVAFPGSTPGYAITQGVDGVPVAVPLQVSGVTVQTQPFYGYPQAGQTGIGGPVPFQAFGNQPHHVVATSSGSDFPPQYTEKSQQVPLPEQS